MVLFLLVVIVAVVLGIIGAVAHGLLAIAAVLLLADLAFITMRWRRSGRPAQR